MCGCRSPRTVARAPKPVGPPVLPGSQLGFTLVKLALALVIFGLVIGGVLKGQEVVIRSRLTSTITAVKSIGTAVNIFRDKYRVQPGDYALASMRIGAPARIPWIMGDGSSSGDGVIEGNGASGETLLVWNHLSATELIKGVHPSGRGYCGSTGCPPRHMATVSPWQTKRRSTIRITGCGWEVRRWLRRASWTAPGRATSTRRLKTADRGTGSTRMTAASCLEPETPAESAEDFTYNRSAENICAIKFGLQRVPALGPSCPREGGIIRE